MLVKSSLKNIIQMIKFFFIITLSFMILSCANQESVDKSDTINNPEYGLLQNSESAPFSFELTDEINIETSEDFIIGSIANLIRDKEGNFYFLDYQQNKLISVDSDGNIRWITGEKGRGPGDLENAYSMIKTNDGLVVSNLSGARFDLFSFEGQFVKSYLVSKEIVFGSPLGQDSFGRIILRGSLPGTMGIKISIVEISNDSLKTINSFEVDFDDEENSVDIPKGMSVFGSAIFSGDKIFVGSLLNYKIKIFDLNGELVSNITRDFDRIVPPGVYSSSTTSTLRSFGGTGTPILLDDYTISRATWPINVNNPNDYASPEKREGLQEPVFKNTIDIFNSDWKLLYSIESDGYTPSFGSLLKIDDSNFIYTTTVDPTPVIKKYTLRTPDN